MADEDYIQKLADAQNARQKKLAPLAPKTTTNTSNYQKTGPIARPSEVAKKAVMGGVAAGGVKKAVQGAAVGAAGVKVGKFVTDAAKRLLQRKQQPLKNPVVE